MSSDNWCSPPEIDALLYEFWSGPCDLDPCSNKRSIIRAKRALTAGGLHLPWKKKTYENNPYSKMDAWVDKGVRELAIGNVDELITLWPVAPSTRWWKRAVGLEPVQPEVKGGKEITVGNPSIIFPKRLAFIDERGRQIRGARFDSVIFFYGTTEKRHKDFRHVFGGIVNWQARGR
jgi:hypothetical protein